MASNVNSKVGPQYTWWPTPDFGLVRRLVRHGLVMGWCLHDGHAWPWTSAGIARPDGSREALGRRCRGADVDEAQPERGSRRPPGRQMSGRAWDSEEHAAPVIAPRHGRRLLVSSTSCRHESTATWCAKVEDGRMTTSRQLSVRQKKQGCPMTQCADGASVPNAGISGEDLLRAGTAGGSVLVDGRWEERTNVPRASET
jgi:hypothetical protein